ncbi:MAG: L-lactate dehydrogenase complex protein LldG [Chloroflexota bacterium]|nr:L-lactate dehydrogenase complex protein LldG [Chloroflexota bacterium]
MWETPNAQVGVVVTEIIAGRRPVLCGPGVDHLPGIPEVLRWPECGTAGAASAAIAVVWARAAATQTGSVLLDSASGRGRSASLLPPAVVFLVPADALVETPGDILRHPQRWFDERLPSQVLLVTGPSRSADIEMTLTRGVHGPGEVHVVVVDR